MDDSVSPPLLDSVSPSELPVPLDFDSLPLLVTSPSTTPVPVQELLDDLNTAPVSLVPVFDHPEGLIIEQFTQLLRRYRRGILRHRRERTGEHEQLRLAYLLGELHHRHKRTVLPVLEQEIPSRARFHTLRALKRTYAVVSRIGLTRLYGTTVLSVSRLDHLSASDYQNVLLPGILVSSEDLAFIEGEGVTPVSPPAPEDRHTDDHVLDPAADT